MPDWRSQLGRLHLEAMQSRQIRIDDGWAAARDRSRSLARAALALDLVGLTLDEIHDGTIDNLPRDVLDALHRVAPDFTISEISSYSSGQLEGLVSLVKGALFEQRVLAGIADGRLGDVHLPAGATARLAGFTQEGYDVEVLDRHGDVLEIVQLKASGNADLIAHHLDRFPDIDQVWTTHEAAVDAAARGIAAVDTGISHADLMRHVRETLIDQSSLSIGEVLDEVIPQITIVLILISWAANVASGVDPASAKADAVERLKYAMVSSAVAGFTAMLTGTDVVRIPVALGIRLLAARGQLASQSAENLRKLGEVIDTCRR